MPYLSSIQRWICHGFEIFSWIKTPRKTKSRVSSNVFIIINFFFRRLIFGQLLKLQLTRCQFVLHFYSHMITLIEWIFIKKSVCCYLILKSIAIKPKQILIVERLNQRHYSTNNNNNNVLSVFHLQRKKTSTLLRFLFNFFFSLICISQFRPQCYYIETLVSYLAQLTKYFVLNDA